MSAGGIAFRFDGAPPVRIAWSDVRAVHAQDDHLAFETRGWLWEFPTLRVSAARRVAAALTTLLTRDVEARDDDDEELLRALAMLRREDPPAPVLRELRRVIAQARMQRFQSREDATPREAIDEGRSWGDDTVRAHPLEAAALLASELIARVALEGAPARAEARAFAATLHERLRAMPPLSPPRRRALERALVALAPVVASAPLAHDASASIAAFVERFAEAPGPWAPPQRFGGRATRWSDLPPERRRFLLCTQAVAAWPTDTLRGVSTDELRTMRWSFPAGHPLDGRLYVAHPLAPDRYLELATFHQSLRDERRDALLALLSALDATSVRIRDELDEPGATTRTRRARGEFAPEAGHPWLAVEPTWARIIDDVRAGTLAQTTFTLAPLGDFGVTDALRRALSDEARTFGIDTSEQLTFEDAESIDALTSTPLHVEAQFPLRRAVTPHEDRRAGSRAEAEFLRDCQELHEAGALAGEHGARLLARSRERLGLDAETARQLHEAFVTTSRLDPRERAFLDDLADLTERRDPGGAIERVLARAASRLGLSAERAAELQSAFLARQIRLPTPAESGTAAVDPGSPNPAQRRRR